MNTFEWALKRALTERLPVVHGELRSHRGGETFPAAWVETPDGGILIGQDRLADKNLFYADFGVEESDCVRFTPRMVAWWWGTTGHAGPWLPTTPSAGPSPEDRRKSFLAVWAAAKKENSAAAARRRAEFPRPPTAHQRPKNRWAR